MTLNASYAKPCVSEAGDAKLYDEVTSVVKPYVLNIGEIDFGGVMADYEEHCALGVDVYGVGDLEARSD